MPWPTMTPVQPPTGKHRRDNGAVQIQAEIIAEASLSDVGVVVANDSTKSSFTAISCDRLLAVDPDLNVLAEWRIEAETLNCGWHAMSPSRGLGAALSRMLDEQDAVLLGRVTFTEWAGCWPTSTDEPLASWINSTPKYVASSTLDSVDRWPKSTLIKGSLADFVAELRQQDGGTIGTAGSPSLVRSLINQGLLDELTLMISPVFAGGGRERLFAADAGLTKFELVEGQSTSSGALIATYRPIR
jgi:dihydrofolate reductase